MDGLRVRPWMWITGLTFVTVGAFGYWLFVPKFGHATQAEIEAVLPASLRAGPEPDEKAVERYERMVELLVRPKANEVNRLLSPSLTPSNGPPADPPGFPTMGLPPSSKVESPALIRLRVLAKAKKLIPRVAALLDKGPIQAKFLGPNVFVDFSQMKMFVKLLSLDAQEAAKRSDHATALRDALLGLRYAKALRESKGPVIDYLVAVSVDMVAVATIKSLDDKGFWSLEDREALLAAFPVEDGTVRELPEAIRQDFQQYAIRTLIHPELYFKEHDGAEDSDFMNGSTPPRAGTYAPIVTARLYGEVYGSVIDDAVRPFKARKYKGEKIADDAAVGLPTEPSGREGERDVLSSLSYRVSMNIGSNTLGRRLIANSSMGRYDSAGTRRATVHNLLRTMLLLRMGRRAAVPDPFGTGNLKIDAKRRLIWSAGPDGKDDGGKVSKPPKPNDADTGYWF